MVKGIHVPVDPSEPLEVCDFANLAAYQAAVEGWIEPVDIPDLGITIYVNEEGRLRHLPFNSLASFLWRYNVPQSRQAMLVGNAVIVGMPDEDGDNTDVSDELVAMLTSKSENAVLIKVGGSPAWVSDPRSRMTCVVLPLVYGGPNWYLSSARYADYFKAAIWAMVLLERWSDAVDTKVMPATDLPAHLQRATGTAPSD
ncbi:DUF3846 domain-containing protein [Agromyces atrinae]|uniref:DUF3846 domain-containing protein n=1 Tax=Agromyces atrinae TaxID=592376 RepID=A0A4Q2M2S5_9MICO|nr:DUF3846 domain-containing protein [Agromyces atrinae]NYD68704.1 hypothetical protein [Agromyces atrinae]RXZ86068.1 DUF3846 domain-containing protein [Agromyces atrinae]